MDFILQSIGEAFRLIASLNPELLQIVGLSLAVSVLAMLFCAALGVPLGALIALNSFRGRNAVLLLFQTFMSLPTVVVGLVLYGVLSRRGPFGAFDLLYTPFALWLGQFCLALPLVVALVISALEDVDPRIRWTALTLGATPFQAMLAVLREKRYAILSALAAGFGRVITEVGCALIVGGNIEGKTRILTTAITLETSRGEFAMALALGIVLLLVALAVNFILFRWQRKRKVAS